ncbi:MAG: hypothetical protein IPJ31_09730 [Bacteroidetes bacterium]|nr:hypothetical protein [Bacteroidota bacterium]
MIAVATNIYEFTNWLKYGTRTVSKEMLIQLFDANQKSETLLEKVGLFEEDFEIFFCVLNETFLYQTDTIFPVTVYQITEIKPLSEKVIPILKQKLGDYKISTPIDKTLYEKLHNEKLKKISFDGLNYIRESFSLFAPLENQNIFKSLLEAKAKRFFETKSDKDNWFDLVISYERAKPYPVDDIGFLYDVGAIYRERFNITDDDIANRELMKTQDPHKYELISHIVELSKFLKTANQGMPFSSFLKFYETSELIKVFNREVHQKEVPEALNHILLYAFFFKFRKLIRDTHDLTDSKFTSQVERFLKGSKEEASIALLMCGLLFGSIKLKEVYYATKILLISDEPHFTFEQSPTPHKVKDKKQPTEETKAKTKVSNDGSESFDVNTISKIMVVISSLHTSLKKEIGKAFEAALHPKKELATDKKTYFIKCLNKIVMSKKNQEKKNPLSTEIVDKIKEAIQ